MTHSRDQKEGQLKHYGLNMQQWDVYERYNNLKDKLLLLLFQHNILFLDYWKEFRVIIYKLF